MTEPAKVKRSAPLPFVQVATAIIRDESLSGQARHLYTVLATYADISSREAKLYRSTLARDIGKSVDTLDRLVKELVKAGVVSVLHQTANGVYQSSVYSLHDADHISSRAVRDAPVVVAASVRLPPPESEVSTENGGRIHAATPPDSSPDADLGWPHQCGGGGRMDAAGVAAPVRQIKRDLERETLNERKPLVDADASTSEPALFESPTPPGKTARKERSPRDEHPRFPEFWNVYPRREDRKASAKAYATALKQGADPDVVLAAAISYRDDPGRTAKFTKLGTTWLNGACWENGPRALATGERPRVADGNEAHWNNGGGFGLPTNRSA